MNVAYRDEGDVPPADSDRGQASGVDVTDTRVVPSKAPHYFRTSSAICFFIDRNNWLFPAVPLPPTAWRACLDYMAPRAAPAGSGDTPPDQRRRSKDSVLNSALVQHTYPAGPGGQSAVEFAINPALLQEAFAADLPGKTTALRAATQRPIAAAAFSDASGPPAWKKLRSWAVVASGDKAAGADVVRSHAQRAGADIVEVDGSHVIMISQPQTVTDHILKTARAVAGSHGRRR